jgi:predicted metal-dependent hydrolase
MIRSALNRSLNWLKSRMSSEKSQVTVSGIEVQVVRKDIRNLHLGVYPPNGRVRVAAPYRVSDEAVRLAIVTRLGWIKRQQAKFAAQPRQSKREIVSGESHYFMGARYRLNVIEHDGVPKVVVDRNKTLTLQVRKGSTVEQREEVLNQWYRKELKAMIPALLEQWQPILGVRVNEWGVKRMKTRWGTCNPRAKRIWLNLELAKKPAPCLEYIVVHELAHLLEKSHGDRFIALMDKYLPQWRLRQQELKEAPLAHEAWEY